ncbi:MAG: 50S ribosomal protein L6 [Thermofilum sp.]|uniref:Large ribosomal subunit protein uL6 n=1 Tax=Thermofilum pendens TaxID=2269 RepID=A0A7C4H3K0_THEPE
MRVYRVVRRIEVPQGVSVKVEGKRVVVSGPLGSVEKDFSHAKNILVKLEDGAVVVETFNATKKDYALVSTLAAHIENMIEGVTKGYRYKLKIVYAHFPMNVKVENNRVVIENFLGERGKRYATVLPGVKVKVEKEEIIVEGVDKDAVAQTAANIHLSTHLTGDRARSPHGREGSGPGILDGIYLYAVESIR